MKRFMGFLLMAFLLLTNVPVPALAATEDMVEIYTVEDLVEFADAVSHTAHNYQAGRQSAILMQDLDLDGVDWPCIIGAEMIDGQVKWGYSGTFDGNGHTISNLSGLFVGTIKEGGAIRNLTLENVTLEMTDGYYHYAGGLASCCYGVIDNCHVSGSLVGEDIMYVGGITGSVEYDASVTNCTSNMTINLQVSQTGVDSFGYFNVGGIAGMNNGLMDSCINYGDISVAGLDCNCGSCIGGIVGTNGFGSDGLRNCGNFGNLSVHLQVPDDQSSSYVNIGGIAGDVYTSLKVCNCFSTGNIAGDVQGDIVFCGAIDSYLYRYVHQQHYENCWATGTVSMTSDISGETTAQHFQEDDTSTLYYLNESVAKGGHSGQYFSQSDLTNGNLVDELNQNLVLLADPTLRLWEQGSDGPIFGDRLWDETFQSVAETEFQDLEDGAYYEAAVNWAVKYGVTSGLDMNHFGPEELCTRGQVVTFLWRAHSSPEPVAQINSFWDVNSGDYFLRPVLWAVEKAITTGVSANYFGSDEPCTRAQVVTFLWRAAGEPTPAVSSHPFSDVQSTDYFEQAVLWAVEQNITNGVDATHFCPDSSCTRGQIVTFLYRAMET